MALDLDILSEDSYLLQNWAPNVSDDALEELGAYVVDSKTVDQDSRADWMAEIDTWLRLAQQVVEEKNYPWPRAANIKYPMLTTAALQFHARAHQELIKDDRIVKGKIIGRDPQGEKAARADRISTFMSMQMLYKMDSWQEDMDRLLYVLPLVGTVFKKTYWGPDAAPVSELILPDEMVVNYWATNWERARKTHILFKDRNEIVENMRLGYYKEIELPDQAEQPDAQDWDPQGMEQGAQIEMPEDEPFTLLECHCWWDLDEDGYKEPYIVTVEQQTEQVLRILPRFGVDRIKQTADGTIARIDPLEYITRFIFFPDVESNIYGVGFGKLLGPLNAATNSVINQLLDAGTLATMPAGLLGRGVRVAKGGRMRFRPGEFKSTQATGAELKDGVFVLPVREPSQVLFHLLGTLLQAGERVSSVAEVMQGKNPGQNQPFATTQTVLEQGMQVFIGIYKRLYRQLTHEYRLLARLNGMFLDIDTYNDLLDEDGFFDPATDFNPEGIDLIPEADPNLANSMKKQMRAQTVIQAEQAGVRINPEYRTRVLLEAMEVPNVDEVLDQNPPPPSEQEVELKKFEREMALKEAEFQADARAKRNEPIKDIAQAIAHLAKAKSMGNDMEVKEAEFALQAMMQRFEMDRKREEQEMALQGKAQEQQLNAQDRAMDLEAKGIEKQMDLEARAQENELKRQEAEARVQAQKNAAKNSNGGGTSSNS